MSQVFAVLLNRDEYALIEGGMSIHQPGPPPQAVPWTSPGWGLPGVGSGSSGYPLWRMHFAHLISCALYRACCCGVALAELGMVFTGTRFTHALCADLNAGELVEPLKE